MPDELLAKLEELKALCAKATPGPWEYDGMHQEITTPHGLDYWLITSLCRSASGQQFVQDKFGHYYDANYDLIAKGRNVLPALIEFAQRTEPLIIAAMNGALDGPEDVEVEMAVEAWKRLLEALK